MKNTKIVELVIEENNEALAIDAISLVSAPAIEQDFVYFGKEKHNLTFAKVDEEKRMLVSPALIPNKQIFRYNPQKDEEFYVYFSKDTVRRASELYLKHNNHHKATYEHQDRVSGVLTTESWIIEDPKNDKSTLYGYDLPKGTWMVKMRIDNEDLWQKIKAGELKGLSIEGYFVDKMQKMSEQEPTNEEILTALNEIIRDAKKPKKVELGLAKDASDLSKELIKFVKIEEEIRKRAIKSYKAIVGEKGNVSKTLTDSKKAVKDFEKTSDKAEKVVKELERASKELGIDLSKIKPYGLLKDALKKSFIAVRDIRRQEAYLEPALKAINIVD